MEQVFYVGQRVYMEKHETFPGSPRGERFKPSKVSIMDGPSFLHYGEITEIDENGQCTAVITTKIGMDGEEIPFEPKHPHDGVRYFTPDSFPFPVYTSKEKCQAYCDDRNEVQKHNWCAMEPTDPKKEQMLTDFMNKMEEKSKENDFADAVAEIPVDKQEMQQ